MAMAAFPPEVSAPEPRPGPSFREADSESIMLWFHLPRYAPQRATAGERGGNNLNGFQDSHTESGSSQGQNRALSGFFVRSALDSGKGTPAAEVRPKSGRKSVTLPPLCPYY